MPYTTEFVDQGTGLLRIGSGVLTSEELIAGAKELQRDPERTRKVTHGLVILTDVTELRISASEMRQLANAGKVNAQLILHGVVAIVAPRDHVFGMARMWESLMDESGWTTRVFRERAEAEIWIQQQLAAPKKPLANT